MSNVYVVIRKSYHQEFIGGDLIETARPIAVFEGEESAENFAEEQDEWGCEFEVQSVKMYKE